MDKTAVTALEEAVGCDATVPATPAELAEILAIPRRVTVVFPGGWDYHFISRATHPYTSKLGFMIRVTIFNEYLHERENEAIRAIYPDGIHGAIGAYLGRQADLTIATAILMEPEHGLTQARLDETDVLVWWGHKAHDQVEDAVVERVFERVLAGMGLIVLHSGHHSKIFKKLMGTSCSLLWRQIGEKERLWVVNPAHPITAGLGPYFEVPAAEMYGEVFDVPPPEELLFISWFEGGEVFRSGATWIRGRGKIFYFRPGHETYPIYHQPEVLQVLHNAVRWAVFGGNTTARGIGKAENVARPIEVLSDK